MNTHPSTLPCPACGFENPAGFVFCGQCGARLAPAQLAQSLVSDVEIARLRLYLSLSQLDALPPSALWREENAASTLSHLNRLLDVVITYLPNYLVKTELVECTRDAEHPRLLADEQAAPGGEFLQGALLLADISGFTALSERLSTLGLEGAEQVTDLVNRYFSAMLEILFAYGGDLFKFGGDALLAFFPDVPDRLGSLNAVYAAGAMQRAMSAFRHVETSQGTFPLQIKIGLHAGPIFAARLGTATERQFIVTGPTVNATAQAESLTPSGQIFASSTVYQHVATTHPAFEFHPAPGGHVLVKPFASASSQIQASVQPSTPTLREPNDTPMDTLRRTLLALDRLTPYLPVGLLPRLVSDPLQHQASSEHRLVGVLFANFVGGSELIEQLGPDHEDEIAHALNRYLVTMQQAISRYGGVVNKVDLHDRGDKLMALFGAPIAHEDEAERAVRAALDMQAAVDEAKPMLLSQRIGVTTGVVFAGLVGSASRREYTVMGDEVNLAARLMEAAAEDELLLTSFVRRKVSPLFELIDRGEVQLKGKSLSVPVYTIVGRRAQPEPVRGIRGLYSPLVGREKEYTAIQNLTIGLRAGRGSILSLVGEAGLGKTRLIAELRAPLSTGQSFTWLESHCLSYTQNISYSAFTGMLRDALGVAATDNEFDVWIKLRGQIQELLPGEASEDILPYLAHFMNLRLSGTLAERVGYLEAAALQLQVLRAVAVLLEQMALQRPMILVFDDLHWADSASLTLLERCLSIAERAPVLICLIFRPESSEGCSALIQTASRNYPGRYSEITLYPLDTQAGEDEQLVCNLLSLKELPPALANLVHRAEGNPFYIEEIIRTLIDGGEIVREGDQWRPSSELSLKVPDTLQGIVMARMDRLAEEARRTLQLASVIGRTFHYQELFWLASGAALAARLDANLALLQRTELVREQGRVPEPEYAFAQAMFRDVAYESLLVRDRRAYHRLVGQQLEDVNIGQKQIEVYELLAYHYNLSDDTNKAFRYLIKAAEKTRMAYANREALNFYRQAEALAEKLGTLQDQLTITRGEGDVLFHIGEYDPALACYERALSYRLEPNQLADLHRRIGAVHEKHGEYEAAWTSCARGIELLSPGFEQTVEAARLLTLNCRVYRQQSKFEQAIAAGEQALEIVKNTSQYQEIAQAHNELGLAHGWYSHPDQAISHFEQGLAILERIGDEYGASKIYNNLAINYYQTDMARSVAYFERALKTMQRLGDIWGESAAYQNLGVTHYARGDYEVAIDYYQRSLSMTERLGDSQGIADCHINLGETYRAQGNPMQAIVHLEKALLIAQRIGASQAEAECHRQLAECCLEMNTPERALTVCREALKYAQKIGDRKEEGLIYRVMGNAHLQLHDPGSAIIHLEQSAAILRELNREFDLGTALYDCAQALKELGQAVQARERLSEAWSVFERLQLPQEQARVQAALDKLQQPE